MHFVDARELQERVQQQIRGHLGVGEAVRRQVGGGQGGVGGVEGRRALLGPAGVWLDGLLWMVDVKILREVVAAVAHKL